MLLQCFSVSHQNQIRPFRTRQTSSVADKQVRTKVCEKSQGRRQASVAVNAKMSCCPLASLIRGSLEKKKKKEEERRRKKEEEKKREKKSTANASDPLKLTRKFPIATCAALGRFPVSAWDTTYAVLRCPRFQLLQEIRFKEKAMRSRNTRNPREITYL